MNFCYTQEQEIQDPAILEDLNAGNELLDEIFDKSEIEKQAETTKDGEIHLIVPQKEPPEKKMEPALQPQPEKEPIPSEEKSDPGKEDSLTSKPGKIPQWKEGDSVLDEFDEGLVAIPQEVKDGNKLVEDEFEGSMFTQPHRENISQGEKEIEIAIATGLPDFTFDIFDPVAYLRKSYIKEDVAVYGMLYYRTQYFVKQQPFEERHIQNELTFRLEITPSLEKFKFVITPEINIDDFGAANNFYALEHLDDNGENRSILTLSEAYVKTQFGPLDISIGKRIYAWGAAFGPNPTDKINPYDLIDPIVGSSIDNNRKIGVWSLSANLYLPNWGIIEFPTLQAIFVPRFTRNRQALSDTRWVYAQTTLPIEELMPDHTLYNAQMALRFSCTIQGWDFSVSYYDGINHSPSLRLVKFPRPSLEKFYSNVHILGADFITSIGQMRIFAEGIHTWSKQHEIDNSFSIVFGADYYWANLLVQDDKLSVLLEWQYSNLVTDKTPKDIIRSSSKAGDRGLIFLIQYDLDSNWTFSYRTLINFTKSYHYAGNYGETRISYKLSQNLIIGIKAQFFAGNKENIYGIYKDNDTIFSTIDYKF